MPEKVTENFCKDCMKYYCGTEHKCELDNKKEEKKIEN